MDLPVLPTCALDADGLRRQRDRYRRVGRGAELIERTARRLVVRVAPGGAAVVPAALEVERQCCPFFELDWDIAKRILSVTVDTDEHEPALAAIAEALGA